MHDTIIVFVRLLACFIIFTIFVDLPDYISVFYTYSYNLAVTLYVVMFCKIAYFIFTAALLWCLAPWLAKKIRCDGNNSNVQAMLRIGFIILGIKLLLENSLTIVTYAVSSVIIYENKKYTIAQSDFLLNSSTISSLFTIVIVILIFLNYEKVEGLLIDCKKL